MYFITAYICMTPYPLYMTSPPHFMASHHFIYDVKSTICNITFPLSDITSTVSMSSHPLSQWYHSHPMYDITYSIHVTSYPLYLWHHIHYIRQQNTVCCWYHTRHMCDIICTTNDITSTLSHQTSVYDVTSTKGMTSQPLHSTSDPLYLCNHNLSTDIIPIFFVEWILSCIGMKQPWCYMCSPSRYPLPPPSPPTTTRFSQCTMSERMSHASTLGLWSVSP